MSDIKGFIFNIERFTLHDGPGIRTTVFLKGCPLNCLWCCNPESQSIAPQVAYFKEKCTACDHCLPLCPKGAVSPGGKDQPVIIDFALCDGCGKCMPACIPGALVMMGEEKTAVEIVDIVKRDLPFYTRSGGGVTLSGGEPLAQPVFTAEILRLCKVEGIQTAIQTCGYAAQADVDKVLPYMDLVIFDLKHMDPAIHQTLTGKSNQLILENLHYIDSRKKEIVLQIPLIPGMNDSEENLTASFQLAKSLKYVSGVSLLAYHALGRSKYARIGRKVESADLQQPDHNYLKIKSEWAAQFGVPIVCFNG
jgi:pyruvate formate lyase activating enzyme